MVLRMALAWRIGVHQRQSGRRDKERQTARFDVAASLVALRELAPETTRDKRRSIAHAPFRCFSAAKMKDAPVPGPRRSSFT